MAATVSSPETQLLKKQKLDTDGDYCQTKEEYLISVSDAKEEYSRADTDADSDSDSDINPKHNPNLGKIYRGGQLESDVKYSFLVVGFETHDKKNKVVQDSCLLGNWLGR